MSEVSASILPSVLMAYMVQVPIYLIWILGLSAAVRGWERYPRQAPLVVFALGGFILKSLIFTFFFQAAPLIMQMEGMNMARIGMFLGASNLLAAITETILWGLLVAALFGWFRAAEYPRVVEVVEGR